MNSGNEQLPMQAGEAQALAALRKVATIKIERLKRRLLRAPAEGE
jgi:hypothetical protein